MSRSNALLSKRDLLNYEICELRAYLFVKSPDLVPPPTLAEQDQAKQGTKIGRLARERRPGQIIDVPSYDLDNAVDATMRAISSGANVIYEGAFEFGGAVARPDILIKSDDGWELHEVKSSTSVKPEHITELSFQAHVLESAGIRVTKAVLVHLDSNFQWSGDVPDYAALFKETDVTQAVVKQCNDVAVKTVELRALLDGANEPRAVPNVHCKQSQCPFRPRCFESLPKNDVTTLPRVKHADVTRWHSAGKRDIADVPPEELSDRQRLVRSVVVSGQPFVSQGLGRELAAFAWPIVFVDFETFSTAIPQTQGSGPYCQIPFQWSAHVVKSLADPPLHKEFLHTHRSDPREPFAASLYECTKDAGSIVTYSSFEKSRIKELALEGVPFADRLVPMFEQSIDLMRIVESTVYFEEFKGQVSIKTVLPALAPGLNYSDLTIHDGRTAAVEYRRMFAPGTVKDEFDKISDSLRKYCERDTLAMVEVFRRLALLSQEATQ